jgi:hypothetical protein
MQAAVSAGVDHWCVIECSNDLFWVNCRHEASFAWSRWSTIVIVGAWKISSSSPWLVVRIYAVSGWSGKLLCNSLDFEMLRAKNKSTN